MIKIALACVATLMGRVGRLPVQPCSQIVALTGPQACFASSLDHCCPVPGEGKKCTEEEKEDPGGSK